MIIPEVPKHALCNKCKKQPMPRWLKIKMEEYEDMNLPYISFRPYLEHMACKQLCPSCYRSTMLVWDDANKGEEE